MKISKKAVFLPLLGSMVASVTFTTSAFAEDDAADQTHKWMAERSIVAELFEEAEIFAVLSATDEDAQVFILIGSEIPIQRLKIRGPDGDVRHRVTFRDGENIGQADVTFESPEPSLEDLQQAYPEGEYIFWGRATDGTKLFSIAELSYEFLDAPEIVYPSEGATGITTVGLGLIWNEIPDAEAIRLEVEDEEEEVAFKIDLDGDATSFVVPDNFLMPETVYVFDIKAIAENGNQTVSDVEFTTGSLP